MTMIVDGLQAVPYLFLLFPHFIKK